MIKEIALHVYERRSQPEGLNWFINTFLICLDQANVFIDSGLGSKAIEELSIYRDDSKPNILIYTHYHFDHVWGSGALSFEKIIACEPFNALLQEDFDHAYAYFKEIKEGDVQCVYADTLIDFKTQLGELTLYPAKGHTQDGLIIHYPKLGLLFMGDNLPDQGQGLLPEINDEPAYRRTLELALTLNPRTLIGSHCDERGLSLLDSMLKSLTSLSSV